MVELAIAAWVWVSVGATAMTLAALIEFPASRVAWKVAILAGAICGPLALAVLVANLYIVWAERPPRGR